MMKLARARTFDQMTDHMTEVNTMMNRSCLSRDDWLLAADSDAGFSDDILSSDHGDFWWQADPVSSNSNTSESRQTSRTESPMKQCAASENASSPEYVKLRRRVSSPSAQVAFNPRVRVVVYAQRRDDVENPPIPKKPAPRKQAESPLAAALHQARKY
mmetsp:Transcript_16511/g.35871  ORF Transcript_16511/g.35871 Transcript_16511/m.35871 type:complete len:158 (-) Transcript_16511:209-682(-)